MCTSCGCRRPRDSHGDARHIVLADLQNAALAAGIPLELVAQNIAQAVAQQDPMRAFLAQVSKPRIVCDVDGVLAERDLAVTTALDARFGTKYTYDDITSHNGEDWIPDKAAAKWYEANRHDPVFLQNLSPYQDAQWALWSLRQGGYNVTIATDREAELRDVTRKWLAQWGIEYDGLKVGDGEKVTLAAQASPSTPMAFFEDNPDRAADVPRPGVMLYLLDRPWNRDVADSLYVKRVKTWPEVLRDFPAVQLVTVTAKGARGPVAAGVAIVAGDTGRVLMQQRSITDPDDPAGGKWEFPGGCLEDGEGAYAGAVREFQEEVGVPLPRGSLRGSWTSPDGVYQCFVYAIGSEDDLPINVDPDNRRVLNPDDPDGDDVEVVAWFDPADLPEMPALRAEVAETTDWEALRAA